MDITEFVRLSLGKWRSQRSGHNLAFQHFEEVRSQIEISPLTPDDPEVLQLCKGAEIAPEQIASPFRMSWQGESDWDEGETLAGTCVLVPIPDRDRPQNGRLLRSQGYAETMEAIGHYHFTEEGMFVLTTPYDRAAAEERIWFGTPNLRFRVSLIKTSDGTGVVTASFASEIRDLSAPTQA
jgi:phycoerythrin-associated linker protein